MRERGSFGVVLERKLAEAGWRPTSAFEARPSSVPAPPPPVFFGASAQSWGRDVARPAACIAYAGQFRTRPRAVEPSRVLSSAQQRAARELTSFGAPGLDADFTDADVKRAYRCLARRFHPDFHPDATAEERAYLAHAFGRITTAYRQLSGPSIS